MRPFVVSEIVTTIADRQSIRPFIRFVSTQRDDVLAEFDAVLDCGPSNIGSQSSKSVVLTITEEMLKDIGYEFGAVKSPLRRAISDREERPFDRNSIFLLCSFSAR